MKRKKIDSQTEQKIVTGLVTSKDFIAQSYPIIELELFQAKHLRQIALWALKYYERYGEAPKENIEGLYHTWVRKGKAQEEVIDAVHDVLEHLSDEYESGGELNIPYLLDGTVDYFNTRKMETLKDEIDYHLTEGQAEEAAGAIANFSIGTSKGGGGINPLNNEEAWDAAYADSQKPLITWGNKDADFFFGHALTRDGLIGILAPEKRGKTWWCIEFAMRATAQRRKVALFEVGDMSEAQMLRRIGVRLSRRPMFKKNLGEITIPRKVWKDGEEIAVDYRTVECVKISNASRSKKAVDKFLRGSGIKKDDPHLMISTHANSAINIAGINSVLNQWEVSSGFIPDVIIIDYPDILAPEEGSSSMNTRDQVNQTWKAMRRLSQERHTLVLAPTQADAASYSQETLQAGNFSEDKRKMAHVTGLLGLNQTAEEKAQKLMRLNWIALREGDFSPHTCLYVGQCFELGQAFCCASLVGGWRI
jgi:hypothetical protein